MDHKCAAIIIGLFLFIAIVQGAAMQRGERCLCKNPSKKLDARKIVKVDIYPPGPNCDREEYVVTIKEKGKKNKTKCVDASSKEVKSKLEKAEKNNKKIKIIKHASRN